MGEIQQKIAIVFNHLLKLAAWRNFQLLNQLHQAGVAVPKPIAASVKKAN